MKSPFAAYIKKSVITVTIAYGLYLLYGLATKPYIQHSESPKEPKATQESISQSMPEQNPSKPSVIDIQDRIYSAEELVNLFKAHEFRATNFFRKCRVMVQGKIGKIGFVPFNTKPQIELIVANSTDDLYFEFEKNDNISNEIAKYNVGDTVIIAGGNASKGPLGGIFLDGSRIMDTQTSRKSNKILAMNGGILDRTICKK